MCVCLPAVCTNLPVLHRLSVSVCLCLSVCMDVCICYLPSLALRRPLLGGFGDGGGLEVMVMKMHRTSPMVLYRGNNQEWETHQ